MTILPLLSWLLLLLAQSCGALQSPAASHRPHQPAQASQTEAGTSQCPSCALARMRRAGGGGHQGAGVEEEEEEEDNGAIEEAQQDVVEAVKRHILNMLHLQERPNITRPVPRAALLNALRKLHVGRVAEDGSVQIEGEEEGRGRGGRGGGGGGVGGAGAGDAGEPQETTEIITFAKAGDTQGVISFKLSREGGDLSLVEQSNVWLFLRLAKNNRSRAKVTIRLIQQRQATATAPAQDDLLLAQKMVDTRRSGWHTFPVSAAVQALLESGEGPADLSLRVSCPLCANAGATPVLVSGRASQRDQSHRPFLMAVVRPGDGSEHRRRRRRGLECDGKVRMCCKRQFYVNFKDIGWNDWIIAPPGYHANYCEGECPTHVASITGSSLSFHSTVINHYRMRGYSPFQNMRSCCVPTRLRAMSMLYYNEEQKIVKKDIQNMIVEECGCS